MQSIPFIEWCLNHLDYWVITLLMAIESSFIPFPSEIVVPPAAYMAAQGEDPLLSLFFVILSASAGSMIGAFVNYYLSLWLGRPAVYRFADSRLGRMCLLSPEKIKYAEDYFNDHGAVGTFVGRLIPAVRQLISIPAGLSRMHLVKFSCYTFLGATIWNIILAVLGYNLAHFVPREELDSYVMRYSHYLQEAFVLIVAVLLLWYIYKKVRR